MVKNNNVGIILIVISIFMLIGFPNANLEGGTRSTVLAFSFCVLLPFVGGIIILISNRNRKK